MRAIAGGVQWGDVASWVAGLATAAALFLTYALLRLTAREQRAQRTEERRRQAREVSAWCRKAEPSARAGIVAVTVCLQNLSDEPIYGMRLAVGSNWWSTTAPYVEIDLPYVTAPHYKEDHVAHLRIDRPANSSYRESSPPVEIIFSDASGGRFWRRDRYGGLSEITDKLPPKASDHFFKAPANPIESK